MKKSNDDIYEISNTQIKNLIDLADFKKTDVFYDLGSGRGRIIRTVSKYVKRAIGVEAEKKYYEASRKLSLRKISQTQLKKIEFWLGEFSYGDDECYEYDISNATVVYNSLVEEDNSEVVFVTLESQLTLIIPFSIKYSMPFTKSSFLIDPSDHHFALFLIHTGIVVEVVVLTDFLSSLMVPSFIKNSIPSVKSESVI